MGVTFSQLFPPRPEFTEADLADLSGKVAIVTGGASGIGAELAEILYMAQAKVYIAGRSETKAMQVTSAITAKRGPSRAGHGSLDFVDVDLADLSTIKSAVLKFQSKEISLDILFNNAGVSLPPSGSLSAQGYELMLATNVLGPHLLTQLLLPTLKRTAGSRVVWTTSQNAELGAPNGCFIMDRICQPPLDQVYNYISSKIGNHFLSSELARTETVVSVVQNPGNVKTDLLRHMPGWQRSLVSPLLHSAR